MNNLSNKNNLICGCVIDEPNIKYEKGVYTGIIIDIWEKIAQENNIKYKYVNAGNNYNDSLKEIHKYDLILGCFIVTPERYNKYIFSESLFDVKLGIAHIKMNKGLNIVKRLSYNLRYIVLIMTIIFIIAILIFFYLEYGKFYNINKLDQSYMTIGLTLLQQGAMKSPKSKLGGIFLLIISFTTIILTSIMTAITTKTVFDHDIEKALYSENSSMANKRFLIQKGHYNINKISNKIPGLLIKEYNGIAENMFKYYIKNSDKFDGLLINQINLAYYMEKFKIKNIEISSFYLSIFPQGFIFNKKFSESELAKKINYSILNIVISKEINKVCEMYIPKYKNICTP